jgi:hypothetical protein
MSNKENSVNVEAIMADPTATFAQPRDVLADPRFSREIKLKILRRWEHDARSLAVAESKECLAVKRACMDASYMRSAALRKAPGKIGCKTRESLMSRQASYETATAGW